MTKRPIINYNNEEPIETCWKPYKDYSLFCKKLDELPELPKILINTINQYSFCIAGKDSTFKAALQSADVLLPDGFGIVAAVRFLNGKKIKKIAGADLHQHLLENLDKTGGRCFYLGSSESTLKRISLRLNKEYPGRTWINLGLEWLISRWKEPKKCGSGICIMALFKDLILEKASKIKKIFWSLLK